MDHRLDTPLSPLPPGAGDLELRKPSWSDNKHVLVAGETVVGRYDRRNVRDEGSAEAAGGSWTFAKTGGIFSTRLAVLDAVAASELALFSTRFLGRGGSLTFTDGSLGYELATRGWTESRWGWTRTGSGEPLVAIKLKGFGEVKALVELSPEGAQDPNAALLALFGCHVAMRSRRQSAAAGGAAAAGAGAAGS